MHRPILAALLLAGCGGGAVQPKQQLSSAVAMADAAPASSAMASEAGAPSAVPAAREDGRLPSNAHPVGYTLDFTIDPAKPTFTGRTRINVALADPVRVVVLHGRDLAVHSVAAKTSLATVAGRAWARPAFGAKEGMEELVLEFEDELPAGAAEIDIDFEAPFSSGLRGLYRVEDGGQSYAFTQFEAIDARRAFPCFDEPGNKTPFQIAIRVPKGMMAVANTPEMARREDRPGWVTFEFDTSPPLPTYLVALAVGPLDILEGAKKPVPIRLVAVDGRSGLGKFALGIAAAHLDLLGKYFDRPYPYAKLDLVAVPNFAYGGMENAGLITFREESMLVDPAHASADTRREVAEALAHELAHQWFGDLVTMQWWDDIWLNESFATWMSGKIIEEWKPASKARLELVGRKSRAMGQDSLAAARPIRRSVSSASDILEANDFLTYFKGSAVLGMVEAWLGADRFREGMRRYMKKYAWGNVAASDLYGSLAEASGGLDVAAVMQTFTEQSGVPVISAELVCQNGEAPWIRVRQAEYRTLDRTGTSDKHWRVPICAVVDGGAKLLRRCTLLEGAEGRIDLPPGRCPSFFYANADEAGYYRVRPGRDQATGRALAKLSESERFGLLSNTWAAVWSGDVPAFSYLELLPSLQRETSRLVWDHVTDALFDLNGALISDAAQASLAKWVREVMGPVARRFGWKGKPGEADDQKFVRQDVIALLGRLGSDEPTIAEAKRIAERWLANPAEVDADVSRVALALTAKDGDRGFFDRVLDVFKKAKSPEIRQLALRTLGSFDRRELAEGALDLMTDGTLKGQDVIGIIVPLSRRKETAAVTFQWIERHFDDVRKVAPPFVVQEIVPVVARTLCDEPRVRAVDAFLRPQFEKAGMGVKALDEAVEAGLRCALLAARQSGATQAWLAAAPR
jgi:alanyl aminopeptidase